MNTRTRFSLIGLIALPLLHACGGGSSTPLNNDGSDTGDLCDNSYYRQLRGRYAGTIIYATDERDGAAVRQCEWDVSMTFAPASRLLGCTLNASIDTSVTQLTVYDAGDPSAYQCMDTDATYRLEEPNRNLSPVSLYNDIVFPVDVQVIDDALGTTSGPYFGDTSVEVNYVRLFDGGALVQLLAINSNDTVRVVGGNPPFFSVEGTLTKE